jgi:hypothetical protein
VSDALTALLDRVEDAASKATPGPWQTHVEFDVTGYPLFAIHGLAGAAKHNGPALAATADLIANCDPDLVLALVAVVRAVERDPLTCCCDACGAVGVLRTLAESRERKEPT